MFFQSNYFTVLVIETELGLGGATLPSVGHIIQLHLFPRSFSADSTFICHSSPGSSQQQTGWRRKPVWPNKCDIYFKLGRWIKKNNFFLIKSSINSQRCETRVGGKMYLRCFKSAVTSSAWCCLLLPCAYVTECPEDLRTCSQSSSTAQSVGWAPGQKTKPTGCLQRYRFTVQSEQWQDTDSEWCGDFDTACGCVACSFQNRPFNDIKAALDSDGWGALLTCIR